MTPSYDNKNWFPKLDHWWFHSIFAILMTVVLSACSGSATSTPVSDVDQPTPEAAIRSLNDAITRGDIRAVESFVYPGDKASEDFLSLFSTRLCEIAGLDLQSNLIGLATLVVPNSTLPIE